MPFAEVNGIRINYKLEGSDGELIVLINGLADDLNTWDLQVPAFVEAGYRVLRYDNRGVGKTSRPPGPYTSQLLADDLYALLKHLSITTLHLLGTSMGGMIAQSYALSYPNDSPTTRNPQMLSLTLANTYAAPSPFCTRMFSLWSETSRLMSVKAVMRSVLLWAFTVPFFLGTTSDPDPNAPSLADIEADMENLDMDTETYLAQLNIIQSFDSRSALTTLKNQGKVLGGVAKGRLCVFAGEEDILIPVLLSRELFGLVEGAIWRTSRGGHAAGWEFPTSVNEAYLEFLREG